jgi:DNA-binding NarL/FixJ family response regulator
MLRIFIADDHAIVREGLKQIMAGVPDLAVAGEASNGREALAQIRKGYWDVVLLDLTMPGMSGLDVLKQLKVEQPQLPILILSMHAEDQYAMRVLRAGAAGYLTKDSAPHQLVTAIRKVASGGKYVSPTLAEKLAFDLEATTDKPLHEALSDREYQVMCLIAAGKKITEIAKELTLSPKTISTYRTRILDKLKVNNNLEIAYYVRQHGLTA